MRRQIESTQDYSFNYGMYLMIYFLKSCCCCIVRKYDTKGHEGHWYRRNMQKLRKIELACDRLNAERELHAFIKNIRLTQFALRLWTNRRQRSSVQFFRRFKVWDWEVDLNSRASRLRKDDALGGGGAGGDVDLHERPISVDRLVNECQPETSEIDARILYEITGKKQCLTDYRDETSESDELLEDEVENAFRFME